MLGGSVPNAEVQLGSWAFTGPAQYDVVRGPDCIDFYDWDCNSGPGIVTRQGPASWGTALHIVGIAVPEPSAAWIGLVGLAFGLRRRLGPLAAARR